MLRVAVSLVAVAAAQTFAPTPYEAARKSAEAAVQQVKDLRDSIQSSKAQVLSRLQKATDEAQGPLLSQKKTLLAKFERLREQALSAAHRSQAQAAEQALLDLAATADELESVEGQAAKAVEKSAKSLKDSARDEARKYEDKADHLARAADKEARHFDDAAREADRDDGQADLLDRDAQDAARSVQDRAEKAARHTEDQAQKFAKAAKKAARKAAKERKKALKATRKAVQKTLQQAQEVAKMAREAPAPQAEERSAPKEVADVAVLDLNSDAVELAVEKKTVQDMAEEKPERLAAFWAIFMCSFVAVVVFIKYRGSQEEEVNDKYLLVV